MVYHHFPHSICHEFRYPPCIPYFCAQIHIYIYKYICIYLYHISISIYIYIYIIYIHNIYNYNIYIYMYNIIYIYISKTCQNMPNPKHHPALPKSKGRHRPRVIDGWMVLQQTRVRRRCLLNQRSITRNRPITRSPDHPVTFDPSLGPKNTKKWDWTITTLS